jgi:NADP-dependent 3-hydroxy acid dehydrogenase YdfG
VGVALFEPNMYNSGFTVYNNNNKNKRFPQKKRTIFAAMERKIALITGASSGIGKATAFLLAQNGYHLILVGRREDRLIKVAQELKDKFQTESVCLTLDVRNREDVLSQISSLEKEWQSIDVLVNNAGLAMGLSTIENGNIDHWDTMIDTNIKGLLYVTRAVVPMMIEHKKGHIVNVGSIAGKEIYANGNVYCATKHAVDALNKSMRLDLCKYPIKVSAIHPGAAETEFSIVRFEGDEDRAKKVYDGFENLIAEDVAEGIWFMLNRPPHVNINEMTIMPTAQPMAGLIIR